MMYQIIITFNTKPQKQTEKLYTFAQIGPPATYILKLVYIAVPIFVIEVYFRCTLVFKSLPTISIFQNNRYPYLDFAWHFCSICSFKCHIELKTYFHHSLSLLKSFLGFSILKESHQEKTAKSPDASFYFKVAIHVRTRISGFKVHGCNNTSASAVAIANKQCCQCMHRVSEDFPLLVDHSTINNKAITP